MGFAISAGAQVLNLIQKMAAPAAKCPLALYRGITIVLLQGRAPFPAPPRFFLEVSHLKTKPGPNLLSFQNRTKSQPKVFLLPITTFGMHLLIHTDPTQLLRWE